MKENLLRRIRHRWLPSIVLLVMLPPTPMICMREKNISITDEAEIALISNSVEQEVWRIEQPPDSKRTFPAGQVRFSGRVPLPESPPDPQMLIIVAKHLDEMGNILETREFPLAVKSTGMIPLQKFSFDALQLNPQEQFTVSLKPMGGDIGPGLIRFQWKYKAS